jgi:hypothetical protein
MTAMSCLADAACVQRRRSCRQGQWGEIPHERQEQEEFGNYSMHSGFAMLEAYQLAPGEGKNRLLSWGKNSDFSGRRSLRSRWPSGFALDLGPPPAEADEEESPVAEELRGLAFEGVADELEKPSKDEQG